MKEILGFIICIVLLSNGCISTSQQSSKSVPNQTYSCPDGSVVTNLSLCQKQTCSDGTEYEQCSTSKPKFCQDGQLVDNASVCGCPDNYDISGEECIPHIDTCSDGTFYGSCSSTQPKYCISGVLVDNSSVCGCPSGLVPNNETCQELITASDYYNYLTENHDANPNLPCPPHEKGYELFFYNNTRATVNYDGDIFITGGSGYLLVISNGTSFADFDNQGDGLRSFCQQWSLTGGISDQKINKMYLYCTSDLQLYKKIKNSNGTIIGSITLTIKPGYDISNPSFVKLDVPPPEFENFTSSYDNSAIYRVEALSSGETCQAEVYSVGIVRNE